MVKLVSTWAPLGLLVVVSFAAPQVTAQDATRSAELRERRLEKADSLRPPESPGAVERLLGRVQNRAGGPGGGVGWLGFRPRLGGLKSGAGLAAGIAFNPFGSNRPFFAEAELIGSKRRYWGTGIRAGYERGALSILTYGRYRHMPAERFYGFGPTSSVEDRSDYRLNELIGGGLAGVRLGGSFSVGVRSSYVVSRPGAGREADTPDTQDLFAGRVPTLDRDARHVGLGAWVALDWRDPLAPAPYFRYLAPTESDIVGVPLATDRGVYLLTEATHFRGLEGPSFSRLHVQSQQFIPFRRGRNVFVFREYVTFSDSGTRRIPLYMLPALGGAYTIRGYDLFRFRDRHALLLNAEYRWQIWLMADLAVFVDAGQVFSAASDLSLASLHGSFGIGLRIHSDGRGIGRIDVARSEEGTKVHIRLGTRF